ncbi:site-specific integrase [Acidithiobacillus ferrianus]|uniref:site-specific integrase n=1 Tax=Acidithiobacillus ferrianus TaxID=2678518 RepID=UPI0034E57CE6
MASILPRKDRDSNIIGWQARVRKKGYPLQVKTFDRKGQAQAWAKQLEVEMERGVWQDRSEAEQTTLAEALGRYGRDVSSLKKSGQIELYRIGTIKADPIGNLTLAKIRGADVAAYRDRRLSVGLSENSVRLELALLSNLFTVAAKEWRMESLTNPVLAVRKPAASRPRERRLVGDEEARLLAACADWLRPMVILALETGMRKGEILALQWENINLVKRVALLPDTKNGTARHVPLSSRASDVLKSLPRNISGGVFTRLDVSHAFIATTQKAGIDGLHFHDLRHEATSRLFEKGLNPMQVAAITGHKTLQMLKRYTHLRAEDLAKLLG